MSEVQQRQELSKGIWQTLYGFPMVVAKEQEMRAYVVEAEAEVPKALAYALKTGKLGIMDYYDMQNIKADTKMRENIAKDDSDIGSILEGDNND